MTGDPALERLNPELVTRLKILANAFSNAIPGPKTGWIIDGDIHQLSRDLFGVMAVAATADHALAEIERLTKERDECERQFQARVEELGVEIGRRQAAEARVKELEREVERAIRTLSDADLNEATRILDARDALICARAALAEEERR